ncbi:MAG: isoleucine--tRNA ligase [Chitinophagales bacterium]|nr:isoleucine--tRNA ligase [Chitinophagales bacterium]MDW8427195.1 isoleucine--tRNA ligase [Chitinophagales bacterium]
MAKFPEYKQLNLPEIDREVGAFWQQNKIFEKSVERNKDRQRFVFYEGPPSANGLPGIHHVISRTIKDLFCRYKTMRGYCVERKSGWDTHGLPVELGVEKQLGIRKEDIGTKISVAAFNEICRREVMKYKEAWDDLTRRMGYWVDLDHPYITFDNQYIETLWWLLRQLYDKGYLYEDYSVQPYSPAAGSGLSTHELNQPGTYKLIVDVSLVAQFLLRRNERSAWLYALTDYDIYLLAWTTTPWTLPSNCALTVGPAIRYALVETLNPFSGRPQAVLLASELITRYFNPKQQDAPFDGFQPGNPDVPYRVITEVEGSRLVGLQYEQLMPYVQPQGKAFEVIAGDFVTTEEGTGIVHTASLFGADDFRVCKANGIASITVTDSTGRQVPLVDLQGRFVEQVTDFAGQYVKEQYYGEEEKAALCEKYGWKKFLSVDERIALKLKQEHKAFRIEKYEHNYPHCWRTDKPVLYYPLQAWFIRVTAFRERLLELNQQINWKPPATGEGRFANWLENVQDWNLSRSRFWGTPLPIWRTADGRYQRCIGSVAELMSESAKAIAAGLATAYQQELHQTGRLPELHKPFVDEIVLVAEDGQPMYRVPDVVDVWFDSGAMPYAQWHYPFEHQEKIDQRLDFPADFIAEGVDQTRGWFYTLHVLAVMVFDSVAFRNVLANGLVLDKHGNKMSKRLGNVVDPFAVINTYGADATRWYLISNTQPWDNLRFDLNGVDEVRKNLFGTLFNTYVFFALYANIDGFSPDAQPVPFNVRPELDRWILSRLQTLVQKVTKHLDEYDPTPAARLIEEFVDRHLSNWYVRLSRRRFWKGNLTLPDGKSNSDKKAAFETLYQCLTTVAQLMSPLAPFFSDWLYRNLTAFRKDEPGADAANSVHLTDWPQVIHPYRDEALEERMALAQDICSLALSIRKKVNIKVRQPLQRLLLPVGDEKQKEQIELVKHLILSEINVKEIEYIGFDSPLLRKRVKPNFRLLGKKLGKHMKAFQQFTEQLTDEQIRTVELQGYLIFENEGQKWQIGIEELDILSENVPGWQVASEGRLTVALDTTITPELAYEGQARELVNQIQKLRKELNFNVTDRIAVELQDIPALRPVLFNHKEYICGEILADDLKVLPTVDEAHLVQVNDVAVRIKVFKRS